MPDFPDDSLNEFGEKRRTPTTGNTSASLSWWMPIALAAFPLVGGLFFWIGMSNTLQMRTQLANSRMTTGHILSAQTERHDVSDDGSGTRSDERTYYKAVVQYEYQVDGRNYQSDELYPGGSLISGEGDQDPNHAKRLLRQYPPGSETEVWYLPENPSLAFLIPVRRGENGLFAALGAIAAIFGGAFLIPMLIQSETLRLALALLLLAGAAGIAWVVSDAYFSPSTAQVNSTTAFLWWLLVLMVGLYALMVVCFLPPMFQPLREKIIFACIVGTTIMSLSTFLLVPLSWIFPDWHPFRALPWIGIGGAVLGVIGSMTGTIKVSRSRKPDRPGKFL